MNETKNEVRIPAPELTSQEWELRRRERMTRTWDRRRAKWAAYKAAKASLRGEVA